MAYYNRPEMVRLALQSIASQSHTDWELAFVDDGSDIAGAPIVTEILSSHLDKVKFYSTGHSAEQKNIQGGSIFGNLWNVAMYHTEAEIGIMLCDDDALYPDYLKNLSEYYSLYPEVIYSYGHISIFDPKHFKDIANVPTNMQANTNHVGTINPYCNVDASQVSWRIKPVTEAMIKFLSPKTTDLDAGFYNLLYNSYQGCVFNGIIAQYKGWHDDQMGWRTHNMYDVRDR